MHPSSHELLAPFYKRIIAFFIDIGIVSLLCFLLWLAVTKCTEYLFPEWAFLDLGQRQGQGPLVMTIGACLLVFSYLAVFHYFMVYFEDRFHRSPGKFVMGIVVVAINGERITRGQCLVRELLRYHDALFFFICLPLMLLSGKKQRLGDLLANTVVINQR
ncbi:MAG: RDD family protein [Pseudobacteriovorax sp.]|nr:RDD family protein [Pseudobacteriovorax sp.]